MSSPPSNTKPPHISPLPRLESYAHYSATPEKLWEGHDPAALAAREASIRARMVARARAREVGGSDGGNGTGERGLVDEFGKMSVSSPSRRSAGSNGSPHSVRSATSYLSSSTSSKPPLKPLILASSAALVSRSNRTSAENHTPPSVKSTSENTTPLSTEPGSGRRRITRQPSALELKYSPSSVSSSSTATPLGKGSLSALHRSLSPPSLSRPSSGYLSPATPSVGTSPRNLQTPSPNLLSPSYRRSPASPFSSTSPTSSYFSNLPGQVAVPGLEVLDDDDEFRRLSMYLADPYVRSPEASPVSSTRSRRSGRKETLRMTEFEDGWDGDQQSSLGEEASAEWRMRGAESSEIPAHTATRKTLVTGRQNSHIPPNIIIRANSHLSSAPRERQSGSDINGRLSISSPRRVTFDDGRPINSPTSLTRPRSPAPSSPAWMWERQPLPPLPCEPPRETDPVRGQMGRKGSLKMRLDVEGSPGRYESLPIPASPSVRSRASSETMSVGIASRIPEAPSTPLQRVTAMYPESRHFGSPTIPSSNLVKAVPPGRFPWNQHSGMDVSDSQSGRSIASAETQVHSRSESDESAVSSLTDVGEVLSSMSGFPSPPLRMMVQLTADDVEYGNAVPTWGYQSNSRDDYNPDRRPSASSTVTVVSDSATVISGHERRDSTPSLSLVRTTSTFSAGPRTPSFTSLGACEGFFDAPEKRSMGETNKRSSSNGETAASGGSWSGIPHENTFGTTVVESQSPPMSAYAAHSTESESPTLGTHWVPSAEESVDDWGEIEILDDGRYRRSR